MNKNNKIVNKFKHSFNIILNNILGIYTRVAQWIRRPTSNR